MKELERLIETVSALKHDDEGKRVRIAATDAEDLTQRERDAIGVIAEEQARELGKKKRPTADEARRLRSLVDIAKAMAPADDTADTADNAETETGEDGGAGTDVVVPDSIDVPEDTPVAEERRPDMAGAMSLQTAKTFGNALNSMPRHAVTKANPAAQFQAYAAADLPDKPMGSLFTDVNELGRSVGERMRTLSGNGKSKSSSGLLVYKRQPDEEQRPFVSPDMAPTEVQKVFNRVTDTSRLVREPDGTFQNTGWCAPSEIDYSFCPIPPLAGLIDLPGITINRGGIRFPIEPGLEDLWGGDFMDCYTESEIIGRTEPKVCYPIPCVEFDEHRLDTCHVCITNSILANYAYPELITYYLDLLMWIFEHRLNANIIARMVEFALANQPGNAPYTPTDGLFGPLNAATASVLEGAELMAEALRYRRRLPETTIIEAVMPLWLRGVMRSDLAKRNGVDLLAVTDADLERYLAARNIRAQWVYDWQDAYTDANTAGFGGSTQFDAGMQWPTSVQILMYPAGTFLLARDEIVRVTGQYDYTLLEHNNQLGIFAETAWQVIPRCYGAMLAEIPICANGVTGGQSIIECPTPAAVAA